MRTHRRRHRVVLGRVPVMARHPSALAVRHLARDLLVCLAVFSLLAASCQGGDGGIDQHTDYEEPPFGAPKTINAVSDATAVAGDDKHTCALIDNGAVRCWLLAGRVDLDELRAPRVEGISRATAISAWERDWCALIDDGTVSCWGQKAATSLDEELSDVMETPKPIEGISGATAIATASDGVCAVVEDGTVRCWGGDYSRSDGPSDRPPVPATIQGISGATTISAAGNRACAVIAEGSVSCWAPIPDEYDDDGHALTPTRPDPLPVDMTEVPGITDAVAISVSGGKWVADFYACALLRDGTVSCWGDDPAKARDPAAHDTTTPLAIPGVRDTSAVAVGTGGACAVVEDGAVWCWRSDHTRNTERTPTYSETWAPPVAIEGVSGATAVSIAQNGSCAVIRNDTVSCWGREWQFAPRRG